MINVTDAVQEETLLTKGQIAARDRLAMPQIAICMAWYNSTGDTD